MDLRGPLPWQAGKISGSPFSEFDFMCNRICDSPVYLGHILVSLSWIADHGIDGGSLVFREDFGNWTGGVRPIVHVRIQLPRLQLQVWHVVPLKMGFPSRRVSEAG